MNIPESIRRVVGERACSADSIGMSDAQVLFFDDMVLKIGVEENEYTMLTWLRGRVPVPEVLAYERAEGTNFLLMNRMGGEMLCAPRFLDEPRLLVKRLAEAMELMWSADTDGCPCPDALTRKLELARERVEKGLCSTEDVEAETYGPGGFRSPEQLYSWLCANRPRESPVLTHGDFCLPNIFADERGVTGFIDVGWAGVSDRYQDIALAYRSLRHNFEGKYARVPVHSIDYDTLFYALGVTPDRELLRYYTLLDELF